VFESAVKVDPREEIWIEAKSRGGGAKLREEGGLKSRERSKRRARKDVFISD